MNNWNLHSFYQCHPFRTRYVEYLGETNAYIQKMERESDCVIVCGCVWLCDCVLLCSFVVRCESGNLIFFAKWQSFYLLLEQISPPPPPPPANFFKVALKFALTKYWECCNYYLYSMIYCLFVKNKIKKPKPKPNQIATHNRESSYLISIQV